MRRKRLLFFAKCPMNYVLFAPVHERLRRDPAIEITFTGKLRGERDPRLVYEPFDLGDARFSRNSRARFVPWDLYVSPDFRMAGKRAKVKTHLFHGFSIRNFAIHPRALEFDRLHLLGPYMKRRFVETFGLDEDDPRLEEVGMPKLDALIARRHDRAAVLEELGLDPARKTVLFAPTWIEGGCLDTQGEEIVRALGRLPVNTIVKLHDNSFDLRKQRTDWGAVLPRILSPSQVLARGFDSNPYLAAADLLISDASSVANEFLVLDRPLVFFRLSELEASWPSTDRETWGTRTGTVIDRAAELEAAVLGSLDDPGRRSEVRQAAAADFFYAPGTATERAERSLRTSLGLGAGAAAG
ncbi:MAG: CDP-glycerol glycerophosphotransferase family protein [Planctomycetota bacterium JB042]